ncbi:MAG: TonB-dependent receptor [Bacteroidia bacterium]|nr:MAG: TonB-dependent receptor [Bacteroidia bacterium]
MLSQKIIFLFGMLLLSTHLPLWAAMPNPAGSRGTENPYSTAELIPASVHDTILTDTLVVQLREVQVTAFNRPRRLMDVPGSITHIGSLTLERTAPAYNILPVLQHVPGVFAHQGATNTNRITIRGIGARVPYATGKIRAYFNNIPLTNTSGITFLQDIDPASIESMEVIKGPATGAYGAGLGGTIVMTARRPSVRSSGIQNQLQLGSFGLIRNSLVADLAGENSGTTFVYSHAQSDGYRQNNEYRRDAITSVSQLTRGDNTHLTLLIAFSSLKSHIPSSIDSLTFMEQPQNAAPNWLKTRGYEDAMRLLGGLNMVRMLHQNLVAEVSLFSLWHDEKEMRPFDVFYEDRASAGTRFNLRRQWNTGTRELEIIGGGEFLFENYLYSNYENIDGEGVEGVMISDNRERVGSYNIFLQGDASGYRWIWSAAINLNHHRLHYRDLFHTEENDLSGSYHYGLILSPRLGAAYRVNDLITLFATISHGFSPPSLSETLTPEGAINPDIRPEKSWNTELGIRGQVFENRLFFDVSFYHMRVQDLLVAERVGEDAWVGKNAGKSLHSGIEAELHWVLWHNRNSNGSPGNEWSIRANYAYNHFYFSDFTDLDQDYSGNRIPGVPRQVLLAGVHKRWNKGFDASLSGRHVGRMAMNDANTRFYGSYALFDIRVGYRIAEASRWATDISLMAENIFDRHHASMILVNAPSFGGSQPRYYYPGLPRHYRLLVRFSFR